MGKQAKKKSESSKGTQRQHNPKTRGSNTRNRPIVWETRAREVDGKQTVEQVLVEPWLLWDPTDKARNGKHAEEPFDTLRLDWPTQLVAMASDYDGRVASIEREDGTYLHRAFVGGSPDKPETVLLEVESRRQLKPKKRGKFKKGA